MFNNVEKVVSHMIVTDNKFRQAYDKNLTINETLSLKDNCMKNWIWYRGDENELQQLYRGLAARGIQNNFWGKVPDGNYSIPRIHSGLPSLMVDSMTGIVLGNMRDITFENDRDTEIWRRIAKENDIRTIFDTSLKRTLSLGWGAFKTSIDKDFAELPITEFRAGDNVEFVRHRGRIIEIIFYEKYVHNGVSYKLKERRGYGYILHTLYKGNDEVPLSSIPQTSSLRDAGFAGGIVKGGKVVQKGEYIAAIPLIIYSSSRYEGYGESIFDKRISLFSALDADLSQWQESVESGAPKTFIDRKYLGHDPQTGQANIPNMMNRYYIVDGSRGSEKQQNGIDTIQFDIPWQSYFETHASMLDSCIMGFMSASSFGIDMKKTDNSESQREKEKTTLYTRAYIIDALSGVIKEFAKMTVQFYYDYNNINEIVSEPSVDFGEYANPSKEAVAETIAIAKNAGYMSTRTAIKSYHGDSVSDEWVDEEEARIKEEQGYASVGDPMFFDDDGNDPLDNNEEDVEE